MDEKQVSETAILIAFRTKNLNVAEKEPRLRNV